MFSIDLTVVFVIFLHLTIKSVVADPGYCSVFSQLDGSDCSGFDHSLKQSTDDKFCCEKEGTCIRRSPGTQYACDGSEPKCLADIGTTFKLFAPDNPLEVS